MKEETGDSKLFLGEIMVVMGSIFLATSLLKFVTLSALNSLLLGILLVGIGSAWKSIIKIKKKD